MVWVVVKLTSVEEGLKELKCFDEVRSVSLASYEGRRWDRVGTQFIPGPVSILTSQSWAGDIPVFEVTLETVQESLGSGSFGKAYDPERERFPRKCYRLRYRKFSEVRFIQEDAGILCREQRFDGFWSYTCEIYCR